MLKHALIAALLLFINNSCLAEGDGDYSVNYDMESFQTDSSEKTLFVMFFAPWCGHCKKLKPTWEELAEETNVDGSKVTVGKVDCTLHGQLCSQYDVKGYPTVKLFVPGQEPIKFASQRTLDGLKAFLTVNLGADSVGSGSGSAKEEEKEAPKAVATNGLYDLTDDDFEAHIKKGNHFVKFYAPWCGHCKRLAPTWDALAAKYTDSPKVTIAKVDCTTSSKACSAHGVRGYPTLKWFKDGQEVESYRSERSEDALDAYITKMTSGDADEPAEDDGPENKAEAVNGLFTLSDINFKSQIKKGNHFVKFYAPWCGHCKKLAPTWDTLAAKFKDNSKVSIAKVDCTNNRESCSAQGVRGYPTLLWFKDGQKMETYSQARSEEALVEFVSSKVGGAAPAPDKQADEEAPKAVATNGLYDLTDASFDAHIRKGDHFVKFYAPWCGHCKKLAPTWDNIASSYKNNKKVTIGKIDCTQNSKVCGAHGVRGYPTLIWFSDGQKLEVYNQGRTEESLSGYISKMTSVESEEAQKAVDGKIPNVLDDLSDMNMVELTDDDFKDTVSDDFTFVMFRNKECKSCDLMNAILEDLGERFVDKTEYLFAMVNCGVQKKTCKQEKVPDQYPVFKLFYFGVDVGTYNGDRTSAAIERYMAEKEKALTKKKVDHGGEL